MGNYIILKIVSADHFFLTIHIGPYPNALGAGSIYRIVKIVWGFIQITHFSLNKYSVRDSFTICRLL